METQPRDTGATQPPVHQCFLFWAKRVALDTNPQIAEGQTLSEGVLSRENNPFEPQLTSGTSLKWSKALNQVMVATRGADVAPTPKAGPMLELPAFLKAWNSHQFWEQGNGIGCVPTLGIPLRLPIQIIIHQKRCLCGSRDFQKHQGLPSSLGQPRELLVRGFSALIEPWLSWFWKPICCSPGRPPGVVKLWFSKNVGDKKKTLHALKPHFPEIWPLRYAGRLHCRSRTKCCHVRKTYKSL